MRKKIVLLFIAGCMATGLAACSAPTVSGSTPEVEQNNKITADELEDGCLYVLNSNGKADIKEALTKNKTLDFKKCPQGGNNRGDRCCAFIRRLKRKCGIRRRERRTGS